MHTFISDISRQEFSMAERIKASTLRPELIGFIRKSHPDFSHSSQLALGELNRFRELFIAHCISHDTGKWSQWEETVINAIANKSILTDQLQSDADGRSFGQRIADNIASFGGSWFFILSFLGFLCIWIVLNAWWLGQHTFDPFPFILLNLILSCVAAIQAPVIMMSQNRQEEKDRERAKKDYMINLKSELEIRLLHEKLDHLILHQQHDLLEIQKQQVEMMNDILKKMDAIACRS